jgi:hypothetical protein
MTVDISERKNAELALAERNMQFDLGGKGRLCRQLRLRSRHENSSRFRGYVPPRFAGEDANNYGSQMAGQHTFRGRYSDREDLESSIRAHRGEMI